MMRRRLALVVWPMICTAVTFAGGFGLYPWYDDWMYLSAAGGALDRGTPGEFIWSAFPPHWSPLSFAFELLNLRLVSWDNDVFVRCAVASMVLAGLLVFSSFSQRRGISGFGAIIGAGTLALHHTNAAAFYAFDCYDQIAVDLLTWLGVMLLDDENPLHLRRVVGVIGLFAVALLLKEQALAMPMCIVMLWAWPRRLANRRPLFAIAAVMIVMSGVFAVVRWRAGLLFDAEGPYRLCVSCVPGNVGLLLTSLVIPVRTLEPFLAMREWPGGAASLAVPALATVAIVTALVIGVGRHARTMGRGWILRLLLLLLGSFFPVVLLPGVTELYAHTGLFWFALLVAIAATGWLREARGALHRASVVAGAFAYVALLAFGLSANRQEMRRSGELSRLWRARMQAAVARVPDGSAVVVRGLAMVKAPGDYGLYRVTSPGYLLAGTIGVSWRLPKAIELCGLPETCSKPPSFIVDVDHRVRVTGVPQR